MSTDALTQIEFLEIAGETVEVRQADQVQTLELVGAATEVTVVEQVEVLETASPGPTGPPGAPSNTESVRFVVVAGQVLSGHRVVVPGNDHRVVYATNADLDHRDRPKWLTLQAAALNAPVTVLALGEWEELSWTWTPGLPLYLGTNGQLTHAVPVGGVALYLLQVAKAITPDVLFFDPQMPIAYE